MLFATISAPAAWALVFILLVVSALLKVRRNRRYGFGEVDEGEEKNAAE
jgi:hypothetical protein